MRWKIGPGALGGARPGRGGVVQAYAEGTPYIAASNQWVKRGSARRAPRASMDARELDHLLDALRRVAGDRHADDWARNFAANMAAQAISPRWRPSIRQARIIRRLAREAIDGVPGDLIEDSEAGAAP